MILSILKRSKYPKLQVKFANLDCKNVGSVEKILP